MRRRDRRCALAVVCQVLSNSISVRTKRRRGGATACELFTLNVAFKSLVDGIARSWMMLHCNKTYEQGAVRSRDENMCPVLEEGMRRSKEDSERVEGILYGCSSFFFSDIRFFLAASIS